MSRFGVLCKNPTLRSNAEFSVLFLFTFHFLSNPLTGTEGFLKEKKQQSAIKVLKS